jgi:ABC-type lipoprotein export system ATPase subunit
VSFVPEPVVRATRVSRTFRTGSESVVAIKSASCAVPRGARIALVGPSGSGKSTLLQILGCLDQPDSGSVEWPALTNGARLRPDRIAFVFQNPSLIPALSTVENVEVPLLLQRLKSSAARSRATAVLDRLGLASLAEKLPEELSGGQAQRVGIARAIAGRPDMILADEPTGQLDQATAQQLFGTVLPWLDEIGTALVVATHDRRVAQRMRSQWTMQHGVLKTGR